MGKNRRAIIWYSTQFRNNLSLYIILSTHSITKTGILKNIAINAFFLEIQCLDIFHNWWKVKTTVISICNYYNFNMTTRDFPRYLHWITSTKGKEQRLGVYPGGAQLTRPVLLNAITSSCCLNNTWPTAVPIIFTVI